MSAGCVSTMIISIGCVLLCCQAALAEYILTHPETTFPMLSGLIRNVPQVKMFHNDTELRASMLFSGPFAPDQWTNPCESLVNLRWRTIDGSCNNRLIRGMSQQPFTRLIPPQYDDGLQSPRTRGVYGQPLPGARTVSRVVHPDIIDTTDLTIFVMQWGQFMDHEMVSTPLPIEDTRGTVQCCGPNASFPEEVVSSECFPILFPGGDPDFRGTCMEFIRSEPIRDGDGNIILPRENENVITSFIDASTVYGSTQERLDRLRGRTYSYLLRTTPDHFPPDNGLDDCVKRDNSSDICFLAGDDRVNEHPALTLMHTVFLRYHNYIARSLRSYQPQLPQEDIFQQARAIVIAVMQNILFSEWLPIVLGPNVREAFELNLDRGERGHFDQDQDPRIFSAFSTAVFRFGHTLIPRSFPLSPSRRPLLREIFFKPFEARQNLDTLTQGMCDAVDMEDRTMPPDQFVVEEVTKHLFENEEGPKKGFDLVALNIQRGRDHGLPSYNSYRQSVDLRKVRDFNDPALGSAGRSLAMVYAHVDDIDLFSGGISEPPFDGGLVGETFSRLMALQLKRIRYGDRFFFDIDEARFGFTDRQVRLLRKIRLSHVLCLTTGLQHVQPNVFRVASSRWNPRQTCRNFIADHPSMREFSGRNRRGG